MCSYQNLDGWVACCGKMGGKSCMLDSSSWNSLTGVVVVAGTSQNQC